MHNITSLLKTFDLILQIYLWKIVSSAAALKFFAVGLISKYSEACH